jgi:hypothetical protein
MEESRKDSVGGSDCNGNNLIHAMQIYVQNDLRLGQRMTQSLYLIFFDISPWAWVNFWCAKKR